ncbi:CST complex subunit TEN1 isoform X1 [Lemur catta]|uniref:CST complex subunit TEN1 isoform X1 n=1 Tax=Lemur catta TaxID=9447 RepID=UPI001E269766|nr:CST complex subunit TEN1 isoform X1 [Lemur catta]XP_045425926.1 CST complex subunit TEN1 isoform X1 [Lemur catta]XP_045425927.1 CST complex subunit TEN1 isoform X1 [Lemur catta]XP_045425928.1 CST complex subunit TEN1 isoform X1 [Lemur catta]XP_045425929.1 CST complex subunit TEN1 isoform X1 [Lemur catta]XP_045425931.1 CST complex subunit TEN1 isoform X1 [Lemur catta]
MMLPKPGIYYLPWEVSAGQVPDGATLRTFGRLCLYDVTQSRAKLTAQHGSDQHELLVCTKLVEPFQAQEGSLYIVLGELEPQEAHQFKESWETDMIPLIVDLPCGAKSTRGTVGKKEERETTHCSRPTMHQGWRQGVCLDLFELAHHPFVIKPLSSQSPCPRD